MGLPKRRHRSATQPLHLTAELFSPHKLTRFFFGFLLVLITAWITPPTALASPLEISDYTDWLGGNREAIQVDDPKDAIRLRSDGQWGSQAWKDSDLPFSIGSSFGTDGNSIYAVRGLGDVVFWRYDPVPNTWTELPILPRGAYYGSDMNYFDGKIYMLFGGYQKAFGRFDPETETWEMLQDFPDVVYTGGGIVNDDTYIYGIGGNNSQAFYRYNPATNVWSPLAAAPATLGNGADLKRIGDYIYTPRGVNTTTFYRYDINANSWATMAAAPATMNDDIDIASDGVDLYVSRQMNTTSFYRYNVASNTWTTLANHPIASRYAGAVYLPLDGYVYIFRGNGQYHFWKYDISTDSYVGPAEPPATLGTGSDALLHGSHIYVTRGLNTTTYYRYTPASNSWDTMAAAPASFNTETSGVVAGSYIYYFRGGATTFYRYDPSGNSWTTLTAAPLSVSSGGALAYPGSGDYIYATRGSSTNTFWRYSISGDAWDTLATLPATTANLGSRIISDGTYIYFIEGLGSSAFHRYTIGTDSWEFLNFVPFNTYFGSDLTYDAANHRFFAISGYYTTDAFEYLISDNVWRRLPNMQGRLAQDIGPYNGGSVQWDGGDSFFVNVGTSQTAVYLYTRGTNDFPTSGVWTSPTYDLGYVDAWGSVTANIDSPSDSSVTLATRTSPDGAAWSSWQNVSGGVIASPENQFIQVRATLFASSSGEHTPQLNSISITYDEDTTVPTNPTTVNGFSRQVAGVPITSGQTYRHLQPYFTWTGAADGESGIQGYYVYFGQNSSADPETLGKFQTEANYLALEALDVGTNYLRIQTIDNAGNISAAQTLFEYGFNGISPPISQEFDQTIHFTGSTDNIANSGNVLRLESRSDGFWVQERISNAPATVSDGAEKLAYVENTNKLYVFRGNNTVTFYEYDIASDTWSTLANAPATVRYGGGVIEGPDGYLYGLRGNGTTDFWVYDIAQDEWTAVTSTPLTVSSGGSLIYDGTQYIYVLRGTNSDVFWRYDTTDDSWSSMASVDFGAATEGLNNLAQHGATLVIDQENQLIYASQGNYRHGFAVFDVNTGAWTPLAGAPALVQNGSALGFDSINNQVFLLQGVNSKKLHSYDVETNTWTRKTSAPGSFTTGTSMRVVGNDIYVIRASGSTTMYKYNIKKDSWLWPTRGLFSRNFYDVAYQTISSGSDILKGDGDHIYLTRGNYGNDFMRLNEQTGELTRMRNLPTGVFTGSAMEYDSTEEKIYLLGGQYSQRLFVYDIATNTWAEETDDPPPLSVGTGTSMVYDGSRYIYVNRGASTTTFWRFDTQGSAGAKWETMANAPLSLGSGAKLVAKDGYIYTLRGLNQANNPLMRYNIATDTWDAAATLSNLGTTVNTDGFLVDGQDGYLYAARGVNTTDYYRYNIATDTWSQLPAMPLNVNAGGMGESNQLNKIYAYAGTGTGSANDGLYTYIVNTATSGFFEDGEYISQTHDLTDVYRWANLAVEFSRPDNTSLLIQTRVSDDGIAWTEWTDVSHESLINGVYNYKINSPTAQYAQVKFGFSSADGISSPVIDSYTLNYYQDTSPPTNPLTAGLQAFSTNAPGTPITTDTWYAHAEPHFVWPAAEDTNGATDGATGSGVSGYFVYFGTDDAADPAVSGTLQTGTTFTASSLTTDLTYYLRIRTVDDAGNLSAATWQPFIYRYDSNGPSAPVNIVPDPPNYTSIDDFSFSWNASTSDGAPVSQYCYKTGADTGTWATDQCTNNLFVDNVPSHKVGANTFMVRALDAAGNYSAYAQASYFFVDAGNAPAPPTNLQVTPTVNTENSFGFTWDPPAIGTYFGSVSNMTYHYSINALPTPQSTTATAVRVLLAGPYATLPGENVFYVVTRDEAGNINYNNYASVTFTANTSAPGIPQEVDIADVSVKASESWRIAVAWEEPTFGEVAQYKIHRSIDGETFTYHAATGGSAFVDAGLTQQTYYYKVQACDSTNNCGEFSEVVEMFPDGRFLESPILTAEPVATQITTKKATISWSTDRTSDSKVAFGLSSGEYFETEIYNSLQEINHVVELPNLTPGTKYYFIAKWTDEDGNTGETDEYEFETDPPPTTEEPTAKLIGLNNAFIEFTSRNALKAKVYYGETAGFGQTVEIATGLAEGTHTVELTELLDGTKYFYKINTFDLDGAEYEGEVHSFTTLPRPRLSAIRINQVIGTAQSTLLISWESNTEVSSIVTYYPTAEPGKAIDEVNIALKAGRHRMILQNLEPATPYTVIVTGRDVAGNQAQSSINQITTASDTRPPKITDLRVESEIIGLGAEATAQLIVSYKTDEPGTSQVEFGEGTGATYPSKTQEDTTLISNHLVIISELTPGKVYHLRALSRDLAGNLGASEDKVVITQKATENALDLVIQSLRGAFRFLGEL